MKDEEVFTKIEDDINTSNKVEETKLENPFVTGLPNWDLEPPFETIKRGKKE